MGLEFTTAQPEVDEAPRRGEQPYQYALRLAASKAHAVGESVNRGLVIGADTIVVIDGRVLVKPQDEEEARSHLLLLRGRWHKVGTAVAVLDTASGRTVSDIEWTEVKLRHFTLEELGDYIATGDPFDKAGGYAIQHPTFRPVDELRGAKDNVIGLPRDLVRALLRKVN